MAPAAEFRETTLAGGLAAAGWAVEVREDVADWLVLPDGAVDVVLVRGAEPLVAGPATRPSVLAQRAGARTVGLRLRPGAVVAALGVRADELRDLASPVCGASGAVAGRRPARAGGARRLAVSPRHLRRRVAEQVGYGPKRYARIMRLQRLLALRARHPGAPAGRLAADAGYADHPHLVRDCRELAGRTPSALLAQRAGVALGAP